MNRSVARLTLVAFAVLVSTALGSATAVASDLGDYLWQRRPLLLFAPTASDPRLVETLGRVEADQCGFVERDMVLGVMVVEGNSTLDGRPVDARESRRLAEQYGVGREDFTVVLIGKDGGEKLRVDDVPDLQTIYGVVDGMPMRSREASANPSRC